MSKEEALAISTFSSQAMVDDCLWLVGDVKKEELYLDNRW
jgi:hypothetical protein